jgi:hypothetical protein
MSETRILIRLLTDVFSTELGIRLSFVRTSEFREGRVEPPLGTPLEKRRYLASTRVRILHRPACNVSLYGLWCFGLHVVYISLDKMTSGWLRHEYLLSSEVRCRVVSENPAALIFIPNDRPRIFPRYDAKCQTTPWRQILENSTFHCDRHENLISRVLSTFRPLMFVGNRHVRTRVTMCVGFMCWDFVILKSVRMLLRVWWHLVIGLCLRKELRSMYFNILCNFVAVVDWFLVYLMTLNVSLHYVDYSFINKCE